MTGTLNHENLLFRMVNFLVVMFLVLNDDHRLGSDMNRSRSWLKYDHFFLLFVVIWFRSSSYQRQGDQSKDDQEFHCEGMVSGSDGSRNQEVDLKTSVKICCQKTSDFCIKKSRFLYSNKKRREQVKIQMDR